MMYLEVCSVSQKHTVKLLYFCTFSHEITQRVEAEWKATSGSEGRVRQLLSQLQKSLSFWILSRLFPSIFISRTHEDDGRKSETLETCRSAKFVSSSFIFANKCSAVCQPFQDAFIHNRSTLKCQCGSVVFLFLVNLKCRPTVPGESK